MNKIKNKYQSVGKLFVSKNVVSAPEFKVFNVALLLTAGGEN